MRSGCRRLNAVKEVREEAGIEVAAQSLSALRHKAKLAYEPDARNFYKLFFLCRRVDDEEPMAGAEVSDVGYFAPDALPPLSLGRTVEADILAAFRHSAAEAPITLFD
jgi:ADP-ribose pyrophosphatase YjhB (NUDIX family)